VQKSNFSFSVLSSFILFFTLFASCKKCITCERKDAAGNVLMQATKTCGTKKELEAEEKRVKDQASLLIGATYTCVDSD
jgi:hypothetical protein